MPDGDYRAQDKKVTPPPRNRIDESMEALIHHFKLFTEGLPGGTRGRLRAGRVAPGRARLLHRLGRHVPAVPGPRAGTLVRQPPGLAPMARGGLHP